MAEGSLKVTRLANIVRYHAQIASVRFTVPFYFRYKHDLGREAQVIVSQGGLDRMLGSGR